MKRRKRKNAPCARTVLTGLLLLAGAAVLLYPALSNLYYRHHYAQEAEAFARETAAETDALWENAEAYNAALAEKEEQFVLTPEEREWIESCLNPLGTGMMGSVEIPKIHVDLPIYQGTEEKQLQSAAAGGRARRCRPAARTHTASLRRTRGWQRQSCLPTSISWRWATASRCTFLIEA